MVLKLLPTAQDKCIQKAADSSLRSTGSMLGKQNLHSHAEVQVSQIA